MINDPYADNPQFIRVQPRNLEEGKNYQLVIKVLLHPLYDELDRPFTIENAIFTRHHQRIDIREMDQEDYTNVPILIFNSITVLNHERNRIYIRRPSSSYISRQLSSPRHSKQLLPSKKHLNKELNTLGGKRKKTVRKKKKKRRTKKKKKTQKRKKSKKTKK